MTRTLSIPNLHIATEALRHVAQYDSLRLETYRLRENLADRIQVSPLGSARALRFDDVGYFNRVYAIDEATTESLTEIEDFYRGSPFGCELVSPPADRADDGKRIERPGWKPATRYAWMHCDNIQSLLPGQPAMFTIRPPEPSQRQLFLNSYLRAFDAQEDRYPAALRNMRHLFDLPELEFLMAWQGEKLAGVGMTMRRGRSALLCAGAALPEFREKGCHTALLAARIQSAVDSGCSQLYSWAVLGGQSQSNMERAGLAVVGVTSAWRFSPESV